MKTSPSFCEFAEFVVGGNGTTGIGTTISGLGDRGSNPPSWNSLEFLLSVLGIDRVISLPAIELFRESCSFSRSSLLFPLLSTL